MINNPETKLQKSWYKNNATNSYASFLLIVALQIGHTKDIKIVLGNPPVENFLLL